MLALLALGGCGPIQTDAPGASAVGSDGLGEVSAVVIQENLEVPWDVDFTPDGRMLVTERAGRINLYASAEPGAEKLVTLEIPDVRAEGEAGAMGIAVDIDFERYPHAYVCVSRDKDGADGDAPWRTALLRLNIDDDELVLDPEPLVDGIYAAVHHNGCAVQMDDSGHIWMSTGDANTVRGVHFSQRLDSLNGKILRMDRDGSVPADNPVLPGADGPKLIYSMGHRNPQGIAMGPEGLVLAPEHGTDHDDEINRIVPGGNFGYGCFLGTDVIGPALEQEGEAKELCGELDEYLPSSWSSGPSTIATSGAIFLEGDDWGAWQGMLMVSTLKESDLRLFAVEDGGATVREVRVLLDGEHGRLRGLARGPDGAIYVTTSNASSDQVLRLMRDDG